MERCGAKTRAGGRCKKPAGWGTPNTNGRCKLHGGATPIKHGRYSKVRREPVRQLIEQHAGDPDPLDVMPELAAARALFQDFIERYDTWREAFMAWHASYSDGYLAHLATIRERWTDEGNAELLDELKAAYEACLAENLIPNDPLGYEHKPRQVLDLADAVRHLKTIASIAQAEKRLQMENAVSRKDLLRILTEMSRTVERLVDDSGLQQKIKDEWGRISLA